MQASTSFRATLGAIIAVFILAVILAATVVPVHGSEGAGTPGFCERHGCEAGPGPALECPDLVCPDVTCEATDCTKTTVIVSPTACPPAPTCTHPDYAPCRRKKDGTLLCPRPAAPRRVLHPVAP